MQIILARPRGFCAGVERAIKSVERAIAQYGPPVYVLNDIVHNAHVVNTLRAKGAVFVKRLRDVPHGSHLLFSAHGVSPSRWHEAKQRNLDVIDATCPLVAKVHREAQRFAAKNFTVILIGEEGHDETIGTIGWAPRHIRRIFTEDEAAAIEIPDERKVAYITQTTLSVDDCQKVIGALKRRFPSIVGPSSGDICYATQNRQTAVNELSLDVDLVLVVGDRESANSNRLAEICRARGSKAHLISNSEMLDDTRFEDVERVLITAGASAPETLVQEVVQYLAARWPCKVTESGIMEENVHFKLPAAVV